MDTTPPRGLLKFLIGSARIFGWKVPETVGGTKMLFHRGGSYGGFSLLVIYPEYEVVFAFVTNVNGDLPPIYKMPMMGIAGFFDHDKKPKILLMPDQGKMHCNLIIKEKERKDIFAHTIPETIGCREGMILNFPSTNIEWKGPDVNGIVHTTWTTDSVVNYALTLVPGYDFVDANMTIAN